MNVSCSAWSSLGLKLLLLSVALYVAPLALAAEKQLLVEGLENPESVAVGTDGRLYVTVIGKSGTAGDGTVIVIEDGKAVTFAEGMDDPKGIVALGDNLYVADRTRVWQVDSTGKASVYATAEDFPSVPKFLNDIEASADGDIYVSDSGSFVAADGAVFRISPDKEITVVISGKSNSELRAPNGLLLDGDDHILVADIASGRLNRVNLADGELKELASGLGGADGIVRAADGKLYVSDWRGGRVHVLTAEGSDPQLFLEGFQAAADIALDKKNNTLLIPDMKAGTVTAVKLGE